MEINQLAAKLTISKENYQLPKVLFVISMTGYDEIIHFIRRIYEINPIDFFEISVEEDKKLISLNQIKKFNIFLNSKAHFQNKLACINRVDLLTLEAANNLLKSLEDVQDSCFILFFSHKDNLIPTLKSRVSLTVRINNKAANEEYLTEKKFIRDQLLNNVFWIENEYQKINIEHFLNNLLKIHINYAIKEKILRLLTFIDSNVNKKLLLEYIAIVSSNLGK